MIVFELFSSKLYLFIISPYIRFLFTFKDWIEVTTPYTNYLILRRLVLIVFLVARDIYCFTAVSTKTNLLWQEKGDIKNVI